MKQNILIVGGGGREHAIADCLKKSPDCGKLWCAPGNGGTAAICENLPIKATDVEGIVRAAKELKPDIVFVAPDDPLMLGMVDRLEEEGFRAFGPRQNAAIIEGSKVFSKELMKKYGIPTAAYEVFDKSEDAIAYIKAQNTFPTVIKAEGLALGKGVIIAENLEDAIAGVHEIMDDKVFGDAGNRVVIEEFLTGPEVSVLAFTDGKTVKPMVSAQDHKRAYDHDKGPNTGGMGTFSPSRVYTANDDLAKICDRLIFEPTIDAMRREGRPFKGVLYFGLMITKNGPKVIEYNSRFGDPESQAVLPLLESDLLTVMQAVTNGTLAQTPVEFSNGASCCVVLASDGYPKTYQTGFPISVSDEAAPHVFFAGARQADGQLVTAGGRVLGVTAVSGSLSGAVREAYRLAGQIGFANKYCRGDIGRKALAALEDDQ